MNYFHDAVYPQEISFKNQPQVYTAQKISYEKFFYIPIYYNKISAYNNHIIDKVFKDFFLWPSLSSFNLELSDGILWDPDFDNIININQFSN